MSRLWDLVIGGGIVVCLLALVACAVQMVLEVLAVEASRRKDAGRGQSAGETHAAPTMAAPPPGVVRDPMMEVPDDLFAETVRRAHWDITEWHQP